MAVKGQRVIVYRSSCQPIDYISSSMFFSQPPTTITDSLGRGKCFSIQQQIGGSPYTYNSLLQTWYSGLWSSVSRWFVEAWSLAGAPKSPDWTIQLTIPFFDPLSKFVYFDYDRRVLSLTIRDLDGTLESSHSFRIPNGFAGQVYNVSLGAVGVGDYAIATFDQLQAKIDIQSTATDLVSAALPKETMSCNQPLFVSGEGSNTSQVVTSATGSEIGIVTDTSPWA